MLRLSSLRRLLPSGVRWCARQLSALPFARLPFNSASVDLEQIQHELDDVALFSTRLWETIYKLRGDGVDAVYLRVPMLYAHLIPSAGLFGFRYHHAEGEIAMLMLWLQDTECKVPVFATHHCGVGGLVMRGGKVLVVREKLKPTGWKLPGGYLNLGEDIEAGLAREVKEETGVDAAFTRVLSFRNQHNVQFGRSDIYVIAEMEAQTEAIRVDSEIEEARWMPLEEFRGATSHPMLQRALAQVTTPSAGFKGTVMKSTIPGRAPFTLYS